MTEQQSDDQQPVDTPAEIDCSRPGELLKKAREAKGLTQIEVANKLNFLPAYVPALENEDLTPLPSVTFIKGYLRAYARFLGIDADEVIRCFAMHHPELVAQEMQQAVEVMKPEKNTSSWVFKLFSLLILVALIAIIIIWWQSRTAEPLPSVSSQEVQVDTLDGSTIVAPVSVEKAEEALVVPTPEKQEAEIEEERPLVEDNPQTEEQQQAKPAVVAKPPVQESKPAAPAKPLAKTKVIEGDPAATTLGDDKLVALSFDGECWVEVRDESGSILHAALMQTGDKVLLEGEPPFHMVFGFGEVANVFYRGEVFDFSSRIRSNGYASIRVE